MLNFSIFVSSNIWVNVHLLLLVSLHLLCSQQEHLKKDMWQRQVRGHMDHRDRSEVRGHMAALLTCSLCFLSFSISSILFFLTPSCIGVKSMKNNPKAQEWGQQEKRLCGKRTLCLQSGSRTEGKKQAEEQAEHWLGEGSGQGQRSYKGQG